MFEASSSNIVTRPPERRRTPRQRASSIIYVQLGPDNGGIATNLGVDGLACQAALKVTAEKNSMLHLRVRGSGLDAEIVGELVWLGATQKEVGICFKGLSTNIQQAITNWTEQQAQVCEIAAYQDRLRSKPMSPLPGIIEPGKFHVIASIPPALPGSRGTSEDIPSNTSVDVNGSNPPAALDSLPRKLEDLPLAEIVPPIGNNDALSDDVSIRVPDPVASLPVSTELSRTEQTSQSEPQFDAPIVKPVDLPPVQKSPVIVLTPAANPPKQDEPSRDAKKLAVKNDFRKPEIVMARLRLRVSQLVSGLVGNSVAERWIPPALLAVWRRGSSRQKLLLAGATTVFAGMFALNLVLGVAHIGGLFGRPSPATSVNKQATHAEATSVRIQSQQVAPAPVPPAKPATVRPRSDPPPPSLFANLAAIVLGSKTDDAGAMNDLNKAQEGVRVWTSKSSGYYYCTEEDRSDMVRPGVIMNQLDALQSGYQPRLGQYCD